MVSMPSITLTPETHTCVLALCGFGSVRSTHSPQFNCRISIMDITQSGLLSSSHLLGKEGPAWVSTPFTLAFTLFVVLFS